MRWGKTCTGPRPTGLPDKSEHWANSGALLLRFNTADRVIRSSLDFDLEFDVSEGSAEELVDGAILQFTPSGLDPSIRDEIVRTVDSMTQASDVDRTEAAATLVLSTPEFFSH